MLYDPSTANDLKPWLIRTLEPMFVFPPSVASRTCPDMSLVCLQMRRGARCARGVYSSPPQAQRARVGPTKRAERAAGGVLGKRCVPRLLATSCIRSRRVLCTAGQSVAPLSTRYSPRYEQSHTCPIPPRRPPHLHQTTLPPAHPPMAASLFLSMVSSTRHKLLPTADGNAAWNRTTTTRTFPRKVPG